MVSCIRRYTLVTRVSTQLRYTAAVRVSPVNGCTTMFWASYYLRRTTVLRVSCQPRFTRAFRFSFVRRSRRSLGFLENVGTLLITGFLIILDTLCFPVYLCVLIRCPYKGCFRDLAHSVKTGHRAIKITPTDPSCLVGKCPKHHAIFYAGHCRAYNRLALERHLS